MTFAKACSSCHVRSAIYRSGNPSMKYAKNHHIPFTERVPAVDQAADDWFEWDPDDGYDITLGAESG